MKLEFLCGCTTGEVLSRDNLDTMDAVYVDPEGMLTCAIHHMRRKGWRTAPWGVSEADAEALLVFGEQPKKSAPLRIKTTTAEDRRDNRDPETVGTMVLAERSKFNGKTFFGL